MHPRSALDVTAQTLIDSSTDPLVVVDFAHFSARNTLSDLLRRDSARGLHRVDVVTAVGAALADHTVPELARAYADDLQRRQIRPTAIVGYCSAATLAIDLWQAHLADGGRAELILVEPTWLTERLIAADVQASRSVFGSNEPWTGPVDQHTILAQLHADLSGQLRADGLPDAEIDLCATMLLDRYRAWFGFLFATLNRGIPQLSEPVTILIGSDSPAVPASTWDSLLCSVRRLGIPTSELLTSDETRMVITALASDGVMV